MNVCNKSHGNPSDSLPCKAVGFVRSRDYSAVQMLPFREATVRLQTTMASAQEVSVDAAIALVE